MTRNEFMDRLKSLLADMPEGEREEALQYYNDYFDDAGINNEQEVLDSLGSPENVAASIKADINGTAGAFTEQGYEDGAKEKNAMSVVNLSKQEESNNQNNGANFSNADFTKQNDAGNNAKQNDNTNTIIIIIVCILASPLIVSLLGTLMGCVCGILGAAVGIVCALMACGVGFIAAAVTCVVIGIMTMGESVFAGLLLIGIAFIFLALGLLGIWLMVGAIYLCKLGFPYLVKGIKRFWAWFTGLFKKGEKA